MPYFTSDLQKVSAHTARSIIILLDYAKSPDIIDVLTVRTLLCLKVSQAVSYISYETVTCC